MAFAPPQSAATYVPLSDEKGEHIPLYPNPDQKHDAGQRPLNAVVHHSPSFAHVTVDLKEGDVVVADNGALLWLNANKELGIDTGCHLGNCMAACYRTFARESCCVNKYTGPGEVSFAFDLPGDILPFFVTKELGWVLSKGSFVCGTQNVVLTAKWKGCAAYCCSGEGGLLTHVKTNSDDFAMFFGGGFGAIQAHQVGEGQSIFINTGLFFAGKDDIDLDVCLPGDCCTSLCCSGEGWVMKFDGPVLVYTQNRDPDVFMSMLNPMQGGQGGGSNGGDGGGGGGS